MAIERIGGKREKRRKGRRKSNPPFKRGAEEVPRYTILRSVLNLALECAKDIYPREFGGLLRLDRPRGENIVELLILPGTSSSNNHAVFQLHMLPIDRTIGGTIHSHPSSIRRPSQADLELFSRFGRIHIIMGYPFEEDDWSAYLFTGEPLILKVVEDTED